jgi:hypothetical protein
MSVLTVCQNAARLIGVGAPNQVVGSSNVNALKLLEAFVMAGKYRRRSMEWPALVKTQTITFVSGQDTYTLNPDFLAFITNTVFDVANSMPLMGALPNWKWAHLKYGIGDASPYIKFRIAGRTNKRFQVYPTPTANGAQVAFDYLSGTWIIPREWATATTYTTGAYVSNLNGDIYVSTTSGTSGATEPVHMSGSLTDGGVTWQYYTGMFERPMSDTDFPVLDEDLLEQDLIWCYRKLNGLDFQSFKEEADNAWDLHFAQTSGISTIRFGGDDEDSYLIGIGNLPYTGYGL